ncbi:MAG: prephenate dehydrogenase [Candidatus Aureabacteria bacterium]|nr:prephenate dehydrogenase [Candidatus Auribacterota bacterium]
MKFKKVVIVGPGLIGGSIGKALLSNKLAEKVVAVVRRESAVDEVTGAGAVTSATMDLDLAMPGAEAVVLCTPVSAIADKAESVAKLISKECLITDVGSTKRSIVKRLEKIFDNKALFIGSHPIAGTEKRGVSAANDRLFHNAVCVLTPTDKTPHAAVARAHSFWKMLGARCIEMSPEKHDKILARISHLPHLAAYALVRAITADADIDMNSNLVGGGFLDTTRIASSPANLWADIFLDNKKEVLSSAKEFVKEVNRVIDALEKDDKTLLQKLLEESKLKRDKIIEHLKK